MICWLFRFTVWIDFKKLSTCKIIVFIFLPFKMVLKKCYFTSFALVNNICINSWQSAHIDTGSSADSWVLEIATIGAFTCLPRQDGDRLLIIFKEFSCSKILLRKQMARQRQATNCLSCSKFFCRSKFCYKVMLSSGFLGWRKRSPGEFFFLWGEGYGVNFFMWSGGGVMWNLLNSQSLMYIFFLIDHMKQQTITKRKYPSTFTSILKANTTT